MSPVQRVLVVDDDDDLREVMAGSLAAHGFEVLQAPDAGRAFALVSDHSFDLVVTDVIMQGEPAGLDLLSRIQKALNPAPPVIVCSGFAHFGPEAHQRGACAFLLKPFELADLDEAVHAALSHHRMTPEREQACEARALARRQEANRAAEALLARLGPDLEPLLQQGRWAACWLERYLSHGRVIWTMLGPGGIQVAAVGDRSGLSRGDLIDERLPLARDVIETGSSLLLPDLTRQPALGGGWGTPVRGFAAAPVRGPAGHVIGSICIFDEVPLELGAADLELLEGFGRRAGVRLGNIHTPRLLVKEGLMAEESFEELLALELRRLRDGGFLEVAVAACAGECPERGWLALMAHKAPGGRCAIAALGRQRLGIFCSAHSEAAAGAALASLLGGVAALTRLLGTGVVALAGDDVPTFDELDLLRLASTLKRRARRHGQDVERVVLRVEPPPAPGPAP
jgi:CheY-like chemotaxis protein